MINIKHVAKLANLSLTTREEKTFRNQLDKVITFVSQLEEVDTQNIDLNKPYLEHSNKIDEDVVKPSLDKTSVLSNSKNIHNNYFKVDMLLKNKTL